MQEAFHSKSASQFAKLGSCTQGSLAYALSTAEVDFGQLESSVSCPVTLSHMVSECLALTCSQWVTIYSPLL